MSCRCCLSLLLPGLLCLAGCGTKMVPVHPAPVLLQRAGGAEAVRAAIVRALAFHKYRAESERPGQIVASYDRRGVMLRLALEYSDRQYLMRYLASAGLETVQDPNTGELMIDRRYARMIKRLEVKIAEELERPAREEAAARQRARQHQLAVEAERRRAEEARRDAEEARHRPPPPLVIQPAIPAPAPGPVYHHQHRQVHRSGSQSLNCCINGASYDCPSQEAFQQCMTMNPAACTHVPGRSCR